MPPPAASSRSPKLGGGPFFEHNGLLFLSPQEVTDTTAQLASARPLVNELAKNRA